MVVSTRSLVSRHGQDIELDRPYVSHYVARTMPWGHVPQGSIETGSSYTRPVHRLQPEVPRELPTVAESTENRSFVVSRRPKTHEVISTSGCWSCPLWTLRMEKRVLRMSTLMLHQDVLHREASFPRHMSLAHVHPCPACRIAAVDVTLRTQSLRAT